MDHLPFKLVHPLSAQLERSLCKLLSWSNVRLGNPHVDAIFTFAVNDHVAHQGVLAQLRARLRDRSIDGPARHATESEDSMAAAPVLSLRAARPLLRALQRFPVGVAEQIAALEADVVHVLQHSLRCAELSSAEVNQLWGVAAQATRWRSVTSLADSFALVEALPLQGEDEFTEVLSAICTCTAESASVDGHRVVRHRDAFLADMVGEAVAWRRGLACLQAAASTPGWEQIPALCVRTSNLVLLGAALGRVAVTEEQWRALMPSARGPASLSGLTLHGWVQRAAALAHPATPPFLRASCERAMVDDLWHIYTKRGDAEGTLLFHQLGLPALARQEPLLANLRGPSDAEEGIGVDSAVVVAYHRAMRHRYLRPLRQGGETVESDAGSTAAAVLPRMQRPDVLVNLLLSFSIPSSKGGEADGASEDEADAELLLQFLVQALRDTTAQLKKTIMKLHDPDYYLDDLVRCWPVMDTVCLLVALERLFHKDDAAAGPAEQTAGTLLTTAFATRGDKGEQRCEMKGQILSQLREARLVSPELLDAHGTPRAVAVLLLSAPNMAKEADVFAHCRELLHRHAADGFSREQLSQLVRRRVPLGLTDATVAKLLAAMQTLPARL